MPPRCQFHDKSDASEVEAAAARHSLAGHLERGCSGAEVSAERRTEPRTAVRCRRSQARSWQRHGHHLAGTDCSVRLPYRFSLTVPTCSVSAAAFEWPQQPSPRNRCEDSASSTPCRPGGPGGSPETSGGCPGGAVGDRLDVSFDLADPSVSTMTSASCPRAWLTRGARESGAVRLGNRPGRVPRHSVSARAPGEPRRRLPSARAVDDHEHVVVPRLARGSI